MKGYVAIHDILLITFATKSVDYRPTGVAQNFCAGSIQEINGAGNVSTSRQRFINVIRSQTDWEHVKVLLQRPYIPV